MAVSEWNAQVVTSEPFIMAIAIIKTKTKKAASQNTIFEQPCRKIPLKPFFRTVGHWKRVLAGVQCP